MVSVTSLDERWLREDARDDAEFQNFMQRRRSGEPVHRILGWREFWGMKFYLSPGTLEPRPDSETMIEVLCKQIPDQHQPLRFLDMGTGTGCLLLAALKEFPNANGIGIDQSMDAISTAQKNANENNLDERAKFLQLDWNNISSLHALGQFDVILCNPPYIASADILNLQAEVKDHDPMAALDGGADGLAPYRHIAAQLHQLLSPRGIALFEFGHDQAMQIQQIMQSNQLYASEPIRDLGGNDRIIWVHAASGAD